MLDKKIRTSAAAHLDEVISIRRHIHANPELSFKEYKTAAFVQKKLQEWGITDIRNYTETGFSVVINGKNKGNTIALRADMDALPINEKNEVPYRSANEGVMHACGHDVHTSSLLGAAKILYNLRSEWSGSIKFIFQPGEEKNPGGASLMINGGVLNDPAPESIIGQHVMPDFEVGKIGFRKGMYMASADEVYLTVTGKGGHGALPHRTIDPIATAAQIITGLQQVVSRMAPPQIPSVLSFGKIYSEGASNVIPNEVYLEGTFRTFNEEWRTDAHQKIKKMATGIAESMGAACEVNIMTGYPCLYNDDELTTRCRSFAAEYMGEENIIDMDIRPTAEDFAFYTQHIPGCFYRLGTGNINKGITSAVHTSTFDIDEKSLETGMGLMAYLAVKELGN